MHLKKKTNQRERSPVNHLRLMQPLSTDERLFTNHTSYGGAVQRKERKREEAQQHSQVKCIIFLLSITLRRVEGKHLHSLGMALHFLFFPFPLSSLASTASRGIALYHLIHSSVQSHLVTHLLHLSLSSLSLSLSLSPSLLLSLIF